ncbi:MAG: mechanosensitive ion channel family protein [Candidatus Omnitrophota bacterium]|nr:MAG: mechanosensitive ion channel family protein [Candidatus Omnitrophota bacterium]
MLGELLNIKLMGNTLLDYLVCFTILFIALFLVRICRKILLNRLRKWTQKTETMLDDFIVNNVLGKTVLPLLYFGAFYLSFNLLQLSPLFKKIMNVLGVALITFFVARLSVEILSYAFKIYWIKQGKKEALERSLKGILRITKILIWGLAIVFFLDNLGFKVSTVLAGLGIGGVAVALAAQAILKDLFSYFSIIFDRPFEVGDFIIIDDFLGTVEYIGVKTTRVRSLGGEQLVFSNTDLTDSRVRNYKRMEKRRVVFQFGVTYGTSVEKLKEIPKIVEEIIKSIKDTVFDRAHFSSYGDFSLVFEVVYYVLSSNYNKYMDTQQEINLKLKEEFEKQKIEFAFPTQTLYIHKVS